jgi:hypothetical protein
MTPAELRNRITPTPDPSKVLDLAWGVYLFSMIYLFCVTFIPIPESGQDNAKYIVGFLVGTGLTTVIAFYFRRGNPENERKQDGRATDSPKE